MNTTKNTVLISGGSAGIGFEIAKLLTEKGNHVIITGRNLERLNHAAAQLSNVTPIAFDVTSEADVDQLVSRIKIDFPELNILINNAGFAHAYPLTDTERAWEKADEEMQTNYISLMRLTEKLLPQLRSQKEAAVVNVSSIVALAPGLGVPTYSVSKVAVRAYTQLLRLNLSDTSVKVFELMPPLVNTEFSKEIGGENGIPPQQVAEEFVAALESDIFEIHVGGTAQIFELLRTAGPDAALHALNGI